MTVMKNMTQRERDLYQAVVWDSLLAQTGAVRSLSGFVQNSMHDMLNAGVCDRLDLKESIPVIEKSFDAVIKQLLKSKEEVIAVVKYYT